MSDPIKVAVFVDSPVGLRVAKALAAEPAIAKIGLVGGEVSSVWKDKLSIAKDPRNYNLAVGAGSLVAHTAARWNLPTVLADHPPDTQPPALIQCSPAGLGLAMGTGPVDPRVVITDPELRSRLPAGDPVVMPKPIGQVTPHLPDSMGVCWAKVPDPKWTGILIQTGPDTEVLVDESIFLSAACLAAGVVLWAELEGLNRTQPVWSYPTRYRSICHRLGLISARSVPSSGAIAS